MPPFVPDSRAAAAVVLTFVLGAARSGPAAQTAATVPLRVTAGTAVVDVVVNGTGPYPFLLDTGSSHTSIAATLAATLGAPRVARTTVSTTAGDAWAAVVQLSRIELGPLAATDLLATELPGAWQPPAGAVGVIGRDLLGTRAFTLDYANRQLRWPGDAELDEAGAAVLPLDTAGPIWLLRADEAGRPVALVPDSGAEQTIVFDRGQWQHLAHLAGTSAIRSVTGDRRATRGTLSTLNLAQLRFVEHPVIVVDGAEVARAHGDGLLPLHLFDRVTFRPRDGLVQLSRGGRRPTDLTGVH